MDIAPNAPFPWHFDGQGINAAGGMRICKVSCVEHYLNDDGLPKENPEFNRISELIEAVPNTIGHLANLLEWAKGNRGSKTINPYAVPEVAAALEHLAKITGVKDKYTVNTAELSELAERKSKYDI